MKISSSSSELSPAAFAESGVCCNAVEGGEPKDADMSAMCPKAFREK